MKYPTEYYPISGRNYPIRCEDDLQKACVAWFKSKEGYPEFADLIHHSPNEDASKSEGARGKAMGVKAGWPDIEIMSPAGALFVELKFGDKPTSAAQKAVHQALRDAGYKVAICRSKAAFIEVVTDHLGVYV